MKILLHVCCGPCAVYIINRLRGRGDTVEGFFYNPNIHPVSEYKNRKEAVVRLSQEVNLKVNFFREYQLEDFFRKINSHEQDGRCPLCWQLRLEETARYAAANGFDGFTTTLLISPYQDIGRIKAIGEGLAAEYSASFVYEDFRPGFRESHRIANEMGLYHQKYCGCLYSERERMKISKR
jgi:predicted adenine nucleotide alpha hydrolase (AANH) superfamily ATPase